MNNRATNALLLVIVLLGPGCLETVEEVIEDIDRTFDALQGDYPKLELPERTRSNPGLQTYDACDSLLVDLKTALRDEMMVNLDQHWGGVRRCDARGGARRRRGNSI